jgi:hypothetical protein
MYHYRESRGAEIDLLIEQGDGLDAVEVKSGATVSRDFFKHLEVFSRRMEGDGRARSVRRHLVYGGDASQQRSAEQVLSWRHLERLGRGAA